MHFAVMSGINNWILAMGWVVLPSDGKGLCQAARWFNIPEQNIRNAISDLLARIPCLQHSVRLFKPRHLHGATGL